MLEELKQALKPIEDKFNDVPGNMPIVATGTPMIDVYRIVDSLLSQALQKQREGIIELFKTCLVENPWSTRMRLEELLSTLTTK